jgi:hypothetical protein
MSSALVERAYDGIEYQTLALLHRGVFSSGTRRAEEGELLRRDRRALFRRAWPVESWQSWRRMIERIPIGPGNTVGEDGIALTGPIPATSRVAAPPTSGNDERDLDAVTASPGCPRRHLPTIALP